MKRDEWMCGYAAGLAAMHRVSHDDSAVAYALTGDGLTLKRLREAGAEPFDTDQIASALRADAPTNAQARGDN